jgi:ABC-type multidrug transport system ATPase subunit
MIKIDHVSKQFGPVRALRDISLQIEPGERVAFVGSNGSGKTTLLRALLGLSRVSGTIHIAGHDVAKHPELALQHVAYVPQIAPLLEAPVSEVTAAYAALRGFGVPVIAQRAQLMGLDLRELRRVRFRDLSGGMKQKLLAALALATPAQILVCDEPTSNLDAAARQAFFGAIEQRPPGSILLLCSHREEEVHNFVDRVVELRDGSVVRDERCLQRAAPRLQVVL